MYTHLLSTEAGVQSLMNFSGIRTCFTNFRECMSSEEGCVPGWDSPTLGICWGLALQLWHGGYGLAVVTGLYKGTAPSCPCTGTVHLRPLLQSHSDKVCHTGTRPQRRAALSSMSACASILVAQLSMAHSSTMSLTGGAIGFVGCRMEPKMPFVHLTHAERQNAMLGRTIEPIPAADTSGSSGGQ